MPRIGEGGYIHQQEDGTFTATLFFDISDPLSKSIITGRYELNLSGEVAINWPKKPINHHKPPKYAPYLIVIVIAKSDGRAS